MRWVWLVLLASAIGFVLSWVDANTIVSGPGQPSGAAVATASTQTPGIVGFVDGRNRVESIVLSAASTSTQTHRLKFFLDPALAQGMPPAEIAHRLSQYVDDLNAIFGKQTVRRFSFDSSTDIFLTAAKPHTGSASAPLPEYDFEVWAQALLSDWIVDGKRRTYGGSASFDDGGAGVAESLYWDQLYDRATLVSGSQELEEYWRQIDHLVHELEHVFGAGQGEYYNLITVADVTGVEPTKAISLSGSDPYWARNDDYFGDPLLKNIWNWAELGSPVSHPALIDAVRFADVTVAAIDGTCRGGNVDCLSDTVPDISKTSVRVTDDSTAAALNGVGVRVWKVRSSAPYLTQEIAAGQTDLNGEFTFDWTGGFNNFDQVMLIKVFPDGGQAQAMWVSIFDAQEEKLVRGRDRMVVRFAIPGTSGPPPPVPVPGVSGLGLVALAALLLGAFIRASRRLQRTQVESR